MTLLVTLPFDQEISNEGYDQAAAWARLVERGLRELHYRRSMELPTFAAVSLTDALPEPQGAEVIPLHGYSVKVTP